MPRKQKEPTWSNIVLDYLRRVDDFKTIKEIREGTGITSNRINAALFMLHGYRCVDFIVQNDRTHWFARPPEEDTRIRVVLEREQESKPRRKRKSRKQQEK